MASYSGRQPAARSYHAAVGMDQAMLVWGGGGKDGPSSMVDRFDVLSLTWKEQRQLHGHPLPSGLWGMAVATDGKKAYLFGGRSSGGVENRVFSVDQTSLECRELVPSSSVRPGGRSNCPMVFCGGKLVVYGGHTGLGVSDDLYVFDLGSGKLEYQLVLSLTCSELRPAVLESIVHYETHLLSLYNG